MTAEQIRELPAGRELDALVAEHLMGWKDIHLDAYVNYGNGRDACGTTPDSKGGFYNSGRAPVPRYSTDISAAWKVFVAGLWNAGTGNIAADMEDFGRGAILGNGPEEVVWVQIGEHAVCAQVCVAICKAALANVLDAPKENQ